MKTIKEELKKHSNSKQAKILQKSFKTGKGEYAEGDIFLGIKVPKIRSISKNYLSLNSSDIQELLDSKIHEERLAALLILIEHYKKAPEEIKYNIINLYLLNTKNINNWDLVDLSAHYILGNYLIDKPKDLLVKLANSNNLWERRIAIISTFADIKNNNFLPTFQISQILLNDNNDLIHKAVGWMLREVGKKSQDALENFLKQHYSSMPRTMLRYAIEKFPEAKRKQYLKGEV